MTEWILSRAIAKARAVGSLDEPNERSSHTVPTARVGGIGVVPVALVAAVSILMIGWAQAWGDEYVDTTVALEDAMLALVIAGLPAALFGLADDVFGMRAGQKLLGQFGCGVLVVITVAPIGVLKLWGYAPPGFALAGYTVTVETWVSILISFFGVVGMMNVVNFMDGMDGFAGAFILTCLAGFAIVAVGGEYFSGTLLFLVVLAASMLAFMRRNVTRDQERKTFFGDCGSQFAGLTLAILALALPRKSIEVLDLTPSLLLFFPFLFDTMWTFARRLARGENITQAHHEHLYQRELELGDSHGVVLRRWLVLFAIYLALTIVGRLANYEGFVGLAVVALAPIPMIVYATRVRRREQNEKD